MDISLKKSRLSKPHRMGARIESPDYDSWSLHQDKQSQHDSDCSALSECSAASHSLALSRVLAIKSVFWARDSLENLPIRLTLESVGLTTVLLAVIMPRAFTYLLVYPIFRLVFGTLYPAYASYKAVRTKNVKEYVSCLFFLFRVFGAG